MNTETRRCLKAIGGKLTLYDEADMVKQALKKFYFSLHQYRYFGNII